MAEKVPDWAAGVWSKPSGDTPDWAKDVKPKGDGSAISRGVRSYLDLTKEIGSRNWEATVEGQKEFASGDPVRMGVGSLQSLMGLMGTVWSPLTAGGELYGRQADKAVKAMGGDSGGFYQGYGGLLSGLLGTPKLKDVPLRDSGLPADYAFTPETVAKPKKTAAEAPPAVPATPATPEPPKAPTPAPEPAVSPPAAKKARKPSKPKVLGEDVPDWAEAVADQKEPAGAQKGPENGPPPDTLEASKGYGGPGAPQFKAVEAPDPLNLEPLEKGTFELARDLNRALGLTHRQGRMGRRPNATGIYKINADVIRTRAMHEMNTLSHEGGHALEFHDPKRTPNLQTALTSFANQLEPMAYPGADPRALRQEGFAEFFRWYLTNPAEARKRAPQFYDAFEDALGKDNPELLGNLQEVQANHSALNSAPSAVVAMSEVTTEPPKGPIGRELDELDYRGPKNWGVDWAHTIYYNLVNRHHGIQVAVDRMLDLYEQRTGKRLDVPTHLHPERILQMAAGSRDAAMEDILNGIPDYQTLEPKTPGLVDAVEFAMKKEGQNEPAAWTDQRYHEFSTYLNARNMLTQWERYEHGEREMPPSQKPPVVYRQAIKTFEAANPHWPQAAQMVYKWADAIWKLRYDAGFITRGQYEQGLLNHENYVPAMRDMENPGENSFVQPVRTTARTSAGTGQFAGGVKQQRGSTRNVIDPLFALGQQAMELRMLIARNEAYWALVRLSRQTKKAGGFVEEVPASQVRAQQVGLMEALEGAQKAHGAMSLRDTIEMEQAIETITDILGEDASAKIYRAGELSQTGEPIIYGWRHGRRYASQLAGGKLGTMMFHAFTDLNRPMRDAMVGAASMPARLLRWMVVTHPAFFTRNVVRDQPVAAAVVPGYVPFVDWAKGIRSVFDEADPSFSEYKRGGGTLGGMQTAAENQIMAQRSLKSLRDQNIQIREVKSLSDVADVLTKDIPRAVGRGSKEAVSKAKDVLTDAKARSKFARELPGKFSEAAEVAATLSEMSETGTRMGIFKKIKAQQLAKGADEWAATREAVHQATDVLNFNRRGALKAMQAFQRMLPFLGANIQGLDKMARTNFDSVFLRFLSGEHPRTPGETAAFETARNAWYWALGMAAATAVYRSYYADDPTFAEVNQKTRTTHWVFVDDDTGEYFAVPKPYELGFPSNMAERSVEWFMGDQKAPEHLMKDALTMLVPQIEAPPIIPMGLLTNKDYFGSPVVPKGTEGLEPQDQKDIYTSWAAEGFPFVGGSPAKTDYMYQQLGGNWGQDVMRGLDKAMRTDRPEMASNLPDMFFVRSWVKQVTRGSGAGQDVWNVLEKMEPKANSFSRLVAAGPAHEKSIDEAYKRLEKMDPATRTWALINTFADPGMKQSHPLSHATKEFSAIAKMSKDIQVGDLKTGSGEVIELDPHQRRDAFEALRYLNMVQSHNALVAMKEPGYAQLKPMSVATAMQRLRNVDPRLVNSLNAYEIGDGVIPVADLEGAWTAAQARYGQMPSREEFQNMVHPKRGRVGFMQNLRPEQQ